MRTLYRSYLLAELAHYTFLEGAFRKQADHNAADACMAMMHLYQDELARLISRGDTNGQTNTADSKAPDPVPRVPFPQGICRWLAWRWKRN
jgi:hypothetical protein